MFTKLLAVSERLVKIRVRSHWTLSVALLTSEQITANKYFCMKTRLCNIFKTPERYNVGHNHFKKPLQDSIRFMKRDYL